jgi:hypothetical protein
VASLAHRPQILWTVILWLMIKVRDGQHNDRSRIWMQFIVLGRAGQAMPTAYTITFAMPARPLKSDVLADVAPVGRIATFVFWPNRHERASHTDGSR